MKALKPLLVFVTALSLSGCLPLNDVKPVISSSNGASNSLSNNPLANGLSSGSASDNAPTMCRIYDQSSPDRGNCVNCYNTVLASRCPGKSSPDQCPDPTVKTGFSNLVNQCLAQTIKAGFTCSQTHCPSTQVVDPATCSCINPPNSTNTSSNTTGAGTINLVDVGQQDFGPPVVEILWTNNPLPKNTASPPSSCSSTKDIYFNVANRGSTIARLNRARTNSVTGCNGYMSLPTAPVPVAGSNQMVSTWTVNISQGDSDPNVYSYFNNFEGDPSKWYDTSKTCSNSGLLCNYQNPGSGLRSLPLTNGNTILGEYDPTPLQGTGNPKIGVDLEFHKEWEFYLIGDQRYGHQAYLSYDLYILGSWDGTKGWNGDVYSSYGPDAFVSWNNGGYLLYYWFCYQLGACQGNEAQINLEKAGIKPAFTGALNPVYQGHLDPNLSNKSWPDYIYHVEQVVDGTQNIYFGSTQLQGPSDEAWGIDNLRVTNGKFGKGNLCGISYTFTDSNQQSADYCLTMEVVNTGYECFLQPYGNTTLPFWRALKPGESCNPYDSSYY